MGKFFHAYLCVTTFILRGVLASDSICYLPGECTGSLVVQEWETVKSLQQCMELCKEASGCSVVTYYEEEGDCLGFAECVELDDEDCQFCYTSDVNCDDLQCQAGLECQGLFLHSEGMEDEAGCLQLCQSSSACLWFTFHLGDSSCLLFETCDQFKDCDYFCQSGQRFCREDQVLSKDSRFDNFVAIGGYDTASSSKISHCELVSLNTSSSPGCPLAPFPRPTNDLHAVYVGGRIVACGGAQEPAVASPFCHEYDPVENAWKDAGRMLEPRYWYGSSLLDGGRAWLITGGMSYGGFATQTTEIWTEETGFRFSTDLPEYRSEHCQASVGRDHAFIAGGLDPSSTQSDSVYLYERISEGYITMPELPPRQNQGFITCGAFDNGESGKEVLLVGGEEETLIFNMLERRWRKGPDLGLFYSQMVLLGPRALVLTGGRRDLLDSVDEIYNFVYSEDDSSFELDPVRMLQPRDLHAVAAVPQDYIEC